MVRVGLLASANLYQIRGCELAQPNLTTVVAGTNLETFLSENQNLPQNPGWIKQAQCVINVLAMANSPATRYSAMLFR